MADKKKNTKALVALILAICAVACLAAACIPMKELRVYGVGTGIMLSGGINVILAFIAFPLAIAALVFGISAKHKAADRRATAGRIIGILCIFASLLVGFCVSAVALLNGYADDPVNSVLGRSVTDAASREQLDDLVRQMAHMKTSSEIISKYSSS